MLPAMARRLLPMAVLYGGRIGVAALGLVVLPWLSRAMPPAQFGLAATIIALQTLAVVLDLGLAITIAREFPVLGSEHDRRTLMQRSERMMLQFYLAITAVAGALAAIGVLPVPVPVALLVCLSLLLVVWQNLVVIGFIARQRFVTSTLAQFTSLLLRHGVALAAVIAFGGTVQVFIIGQVAGAAIVLLVSRLLFLYQHRAVGAPATVSRMAGATSIAVMIYTIAGACTMQLDKVLLSALASPADTGPYFLASTLSLVPITFLASPASQFVQPKLIAALDAQRVADAQRWIGRLVLAIIVLAVLPGIALGIAAPWLVPLWLQGSPQQAAVIHYVTLLMPGAAIGALGLIPAIVLVTRRDYRAMATISCIMGGVVLATTAWLATHDAIAGVCITYAIYHALAAAALWWRAARIEPCFANPFAIAGRLANGGADRSARAQSPQP
ncbi:oligosaccharide flippase family protein [Sphingomonas sp.]|jgi:O-antigen/teichoic acid export membrane protein|uniref:lipopolysaccharide biosynthesis protein n=1 Tax=Sphingomonas sp. TaxID=28214 RepID=UPI0026098136|nr:oligosaccharide flippase family protein [Sphingomonas sp.]MDF2496164.1 putative O-antigen transporter [Sphingomonas sp.]